MRQIFTHPLENTYEQTLDEAKRTIWNVATEMGFSSNDGWEVKKYLEGNKTKIALNSTFYTADESKLIL